MGMPRVVMPATFTRGVAMPRMVAVVVVTGFTLGMVVVVFLPFLMVMPARFAVRMLVLMFGVVVLFALLMVMPARFAVRMLVLMFGVVVLLAFLMLMAARFTLCMVVFMLGMVVLLAFLMLMAARLTLGMVVFMRIVFVLLAFLMVVAARLALGVLVLMRAVVVLLVFLMLMAARLALRVFMRFPLRMGMPAPLMRRNGPQHQRGPNQKQVQFHPKKQCIKISSSFPRGVAAPQFQIQDSRSKIQDYLRCFTAFCADTSSCKLSK